MGLDLTGRVAIVTGASRGIGLATVDALLSEGARVVAASRTHGDGLRALTGPDLQHVAADLTPTSPRP